MGSCILCLEMNKDFVGCIKVNSAQWQKFDVTNLIEKHFWSMDSTKYSSSWLCNACWQELFDFHKFYLRVEEAHVEFAIVKNKDLTFFNSNNLEKEVDYKPTLNKKTAKFYNDPKISLTESYYNESLLEENIVIKEEEADECLIEDISKKRRKGCLTKFSESKGENTLKDPLVKSEKSERGIVKRLRMKRNKTNQSHEETQLKEAKPIKQVLNSLGKHEDYPNNLCSDTDSNKYLDEESPQLDRNKTVDKSFKKRNRENDAFLAENFKISCIICQIQTETFHALCKHFKKDHKQNGYVICCNKKFYRRSLLVDHVHQHVNPNYIKCNTCDKVMADRKCLAFHNKRHHSQKQDTYQCDICNKNFSIYSSLQVHKMSHLSEEEKRVPCPECGKKFASKSLLSNHVRSVHLKKYAKICDICGKSIRCKEVFERHMLQHEGKPLPSVSCDVCGLLLANKNGLKQHKLMVHPEGGKQEFICPVCSKVSPNLKAHKKHIQYNHERGYDHKCAMCEKAFKTAHTLTEHMASHTGTVLYTCPWCPKTFNSNANFHSHRKKSHPNEWEEVTRKKYSGNLPPNYNPPQKSTDNNYSSMLHMQ